MKYLPRKLVRRNTLVLVLALWCTAALAAVSITSAPWGQAGSATVELYTLKSGEFEVKVTNYGARIVSIRVPDRKGTLNNVIVGSDSLDGYMTQQKSVMGATVGRYANRIAKGTFSIKGTAYELSKNNGANTLHGGMVGFDKKVWEAKKVKNGVEMTLVSPDGDMGFPGNLTVHVSFLVGSRDGKPALSIVYSATSDKDTVVNFTNHAYFNLGESADVPVLDDVAAIDADQYTPTDASGIPTGQLAPVEGTPLDFRAPRALRDKLPARGYDTNFVLNTPGMEHRSAIVTDPKTGRTIETFTTQPGLQLYVPVFGARPGGNAANAAGAPSTGGNAPARPAFTPTQAFCLETQHFPDSPNHPEFPSTLLAAGQTFHSETTYVFGLDKSSEAR